VGESVGYGATWTAQKPSIIATVALGYADGYPRHAPIGTPALFAGETAGLVGRVSMDMLTFDVTHLQQVDIGTPVELWGKNLPINTVAKHIGTIGYELMTRISKRVPRVYL
jgi:alanine racemase